METISEAKEYLKQNFEEGVDCPCCNQYVKVHKRPISSTAARCLIEIYKYFLQHPDKEWVHAGDYLGSLNIPAAMKNTGEFSRLAHWGLTEYKPREDEDAGKHSGIVRLTDKGRRFAAGKGTAEAYLYFYNKKVLEIDHTPITIQEALGKRFDYTDLMNWEL